jgi:ribokinase
MERIMKVFVVGNIVADQTYSVGRLPNEGESVLGRKISVDLGGKGANQSIILARSDISTILIAAIGDDTQANQLSERLATEPVVPRLIQIPNTASDSSIIIKDGTGKNVIVTTVDCARSLKFSDVEQKMTDAASGDLLVLQGNLELAITKQIIATARKRGMKIVLNPSPFENGIELLLADLDTLFVNQHEAYQITGCEGPVAVQKLLEFGIKTVILSMGEKGALLGTASEVLSVPAQTCHVVDSTGAGDTLQSVAIASAILRRSCIDLVALKIAAQAAALTVSRHGATAAFPTQTELKSLFAHDWAQEPSS